MNGMLCLLWIEVVNGLVVHHTCFIPWAILLLYYTCAGLSVHKGSRSDWFTVALLLLLPVITLGSVLLLTGHIEVHDTSPSTWLGVMSY